MAAGVTNIVLYAGIAMVILGPVLTNKGFGKITGIFGSGSEEYFTFASRYFRIFLFFTFLNGIQPVAGNFFTAIGKPVYGIFISLTRQIIFLLPLILILPRFFGIDGVLYSAPIADFLAACLALFLTLRQLKKLSQ